MRVGTSSAFVFRVRGGLTESPHGFLGTCPSAGLGVSVRYALAPCQEAVPGRLGPLHEFVSPRRRGRSGPFESAPILEPLRTLGKDRMSKWILCQGPQIGDAMAVEEVAKPHRGTAGPSGEPNRRDSSPTGCKFSSQHIDRPEKVRAAPRVGAGDQERLTPAPGHTVQVRGEVAVKEPGPGPAEAHAGEPRLVSPEGLFLVLRDEERNGRVSHRGPGARREVESERYRLLTLRVFHRHSGVPREPHISRAPVLRDPLPRRRRRAARAADRAPGARPGGGPAQAPEVVEEAPERSAGCLRWEGDMTSILPRCAWCARG